MSASVRVCVDNFTRAREHAAAGRPADDAASVAGQRRGDDAGPEAAQEDHRRGESPMICRDKLPDNTIGSRVERE